MEKLKLTHLKYILRKLQPACEVPFRKKAVIEALNEIENLEEFEEGRDWSEIEEEIEEEMKEEKQRQREAREQRWKEDMLSIMAAKDDAVCREVLQESKRMILEVEEKMEENLNCVEKHFCRQVEDVQKSFKMLESRLGNNEHIDKPLTDTSSVKTPILPNYDGKTNLEVFLQQIDVASKLGNWSESYKAGQLVLLLRGSAALVLRGMTPQELSSCSKINFKLRQRFADFQGGETSRLRFHSSSQERKELICEFVQRLESLSLKAYPDIDEELRSSMVKTQFMAGLLDNDLKLRLITSENSLGLSETVARAESLNEILKNNSCHKYLHEVKKNDCAIDNLAQTQQRHNSYSSRNSERNRTDNSRAKIQCYNCRMMGHYARDCRRPRYCDQNERKVLPQGYNYSQKSVPHSENSEPTEIRGNSRFGQA